MKSQGYWLIFIRIMRKDGFFVKGYPFDWTNSKTKIFHNHPINLMKSGDFKICKLFKSITRTKWYISLRLWWKKTKKVNSKFFEIQCSFISMMKSLNFKRKDFLSRFFEIDFTSVNQCFLKFIWHFFIENRFVFPYFRSNFLFVDEYFWLITFQIPPVCEFSLERISIFYWICSTFENWFWLMILKFSNKIWIKNSIFFRKLRDFFQLWKLSFRMSFWRFEEKLDKKFQFFSENFVNFSRLKNWF